MNIFTTDHPLSAHKSQEQPLLRSAAVACLVAILLSPFVFVSLYGLVIRDIGAEAAPFPRPWLALVIGSIVAFTASFLVVLPFVLICRWAARRAHDCLTGR